MKHLNDLPTRPATHDTATAAETAFAEAIAACRHFLLQQQDRNDYGTDVQIEAREHDSMTNVRLHVQLKGTGQDESNDGSVVIPIDRANLNYLLANPSSLYVCYHLPTKRLLARYASDIYEECEHRQPQWRQQEQVTVRFRRSFDEAFQSRASKQAVASARQARDRRLLLSKSPPEAIPLLVGKMAAVIEVPTDEAKAQALLLELYHDGNDTAISESFDQFLAVLEATSPCIRLLYMADINLGVNGASFDEPRVRRGICLLQDEMSQGGDEGGALLYAQGNGWLALGDYRKARELYGEALLHLTEPKWSRCAAQCCKNLGTALRGLGETDAARISYERALQFDPDLGEAHLALALWYQREKKDPRRALRELDQVISRRGSTLPYTTVQGWRVKLLFEAGEAERAFHEIQALVAVASQAEWIWPWCALQVFNHGKATSISFQRALQFWRAYLEQHSGHYFAERERLLCLFNLRAAGIPTGVSFQAFREDVSRLNHLSVGDDAFMWDRTGHWAQYDGNWAAAEMAYRRAYELQPEQYGYCLGTALNFLERYDEALPMLIREAEELQPDAMSWFQVGVAQAGRGNSGGSIAAYHRAIQLDQDYELAWFNLGGAYWNAGDVTGATATWREAARRFPDHAGARRVRENWAHLLEGS